MHAARREWQAMAIHPRRLLKLYRSNNVVVAYHHASVPISDLAVAAWRMGEAMHGSECESTKECAPVSRKPGGWNAGELSALFSSSKILQNFSDFPSHRIFRRMH